ncbi:MAG: prolyl oligopeptidase family serine peptidase [Saprospiraceae bacterium]|nr:prolyl oligopeptidase family serine peptidase [Saprospiraceae bacterium]
MTKNAPTYPATRQDPSVSDDYHGTKVTDPYRWLEDDNANETKDWVKKQNELTFGYLEKIPFREAIKFKLTKLWDFEKFGSPFKEGSKYYFYRNSGLQNQAVLYVQNDLNAPPSVFLDPNTLSKEGTVALGAMAFNKTGNLAAYQLAKAGSDWQTIYIKDAVTGKTLDDKVEWVKFSGISWAGDGFFYSRYPEPKKGDELKGASEFQSVYFHKVGTPQADDKLIYEDKDNAKRGFGAGMTEDERFLQVTPWEGTSGNMLIVKDIKNNGEFITLVDNFKNDWNVIENDGDWLLVQTNYKAPNTRIIAINLANPEEKDWKEIIPENKTDVLQSCSIIGGKLAVNYLHDVSSSVRFYNLSGKFLNELTLPGIGTVGGLTGKKSENEAFYSFSSFTRPTTIYKLDVATMQSTIFKEPKMAFDPTQYETKQLWYKSKDGTKVPMFVTMKKGTKLNGKNPTLLYGYGGFNISTLPQFSVSRAALLDMGGIYVVANIRGGGEFGEAWHKAGTKERKQNVFDDFIGAAEFLIQKKYTSKGFLAIQGGSNGGLLVGACMTQRPDLFRVALPAVGVLDMLRYDKFTIGRAWGTDYGLSENATDFDYLYKYSPLHNIKKGVKYPATMVTTGDHDDRVVPAHSFKFAAALQAAQTGEKPALIRIETSAGHGAGKPTAKVIQEAADILAFMFYNMNVVPK